MKTWHPPVLARPLAPAPFFCVKAGAAGIIVSGPPSLRIGQPAGEPGVFADWRWDGVSLEVRNDRYGFQPLYCWASDAGVALSTSVKRLLEAGAPAELDDAAMAVLLRLGFLIGEDTPFRHIRALPPGARLSWRPGALEIRHALPLPPLRHISRDEAIDRHIGLFRAAIQRRAEVQGTLGLPLSGGQDSRHILFELIECGRQPAFCVTAQYHPPRATPDAEVASELSALLGIPHHVVEQPASHLETLLRHQHITGWCTLTPSWFMIAVADFLATRAEVIFDGIGGDVLCAGLFLDAARVQLFRDGRLAQLADSLLTHFNGGAGFPENTIEKAFGPRELRRFSRALALERVATELARHADAANPMTSFAFFNRTRRDIALLPFAILSPVGMVQCPFLDDEFYDFMASLPAEMLLDHTFHADAIARAYPRAGQIPYARWQETPLSEAAGRYRKLARELAWSCAGGLHPRAVRRSFTVPRLLHCLVDRRYAASSVWLAQLLVYLTELETLCGGRF